MSNVTTDTGAFEGLSSEQIGRAVVQAHDAALALEELDRMRNQSPTKFPINGTLIIVIAAVAVFGFLLSLSITI